MVGNIKSKAKRIVFSSEYQAVLNELRDRLRIPVEEGYEDMLAEFDDESLSLSELDENDIFKVLREDVLHIKAYSERKYRALDGAPDEQEFPPGEQPDVTDAGEAGQGIYSQGFLLKNIIEYLLAEAGVERLKEYFKLERIPNARKYAAQVVGFING
ncbi:hypothetical protein [Pseudomonas sp. LP_7_YM]|uniref:hypothetical protein n=1 Tax=Pseudomonas sp. LP_7_YM TaxID=2485137 RepID=UPI00105EB94B|nr:hypothetical protein [Pseudomonas sp. LP_7_YM]TDV58499.1 hypothetical protein EC915_1411 [Pseudomonas sp. LP_7_YM]